MGRPFRVIFCRLRLICRVVGLYWSWFWNKSQMAKTRMLRVELCFMSIYFLVKRSEAVAI